MPNLLQQFRDLVGSDPLLVGDVVAVTAGGVVVELPGGAQITARGVAQVNDRVFVRAGAIQGPAPALPVSVLDV